MARLRYNNAVGQLGAALLADAGPDTINFGLTAPPFATLVAPDYVPLILDPPLGAQPSSAFEIVALTAYAAGALTGTISRAQEGTTAQAHVNGARWQCGPTVLDIPGINFRGGWRNDTAYAIGDATVYNGLSYVCTTAISAPTNTLTNFGTVTPKGTPQSGVQVGGTIVSTDPPESALGTARNIFTNIHLWQVKMAVSGSINLTIAGAQFGLFDVFDSGGTLKAGSGGAGTFAPFGTNFLTPYYYMVVGTNAPPLAYTMTITNNGGTLAGIPANTPPDQDSTHWAVSGTGVAATSTPGLMAPIIERVNAQGASGAAYTIPDVTSDTVHRVVLTANCTLTFPAAAAGKKFRVGLVQDGTGSRTVTWPGTVKWAAGGTAPTLTTTANKTDLLEFTCIDGTNWVGIVVGQNI